MAYVRKTIDVFEVQGLYLGKWELECNELNPKEAKQRAKEYRENNPSVPIRIRRHRELKQEVQ